MRTVYWTCPLNVVSITNVVTYCITVCKLYWKKLYFREVQFLQHGTWTDLPHTNCRCPSDIPHITDDNDCNDDGGQIIRRTNSEYHPIVNAMDADNNTVWMSSPGKRETISITIEMGNQMYQVKI